MLDAYLPKYDENPQKLLRSAFMGFASSAVSDTCSNSIRVLKVTLTFQIVFYYIFLNLFIEYLTYLLTYLLNITVFTGL
jgi:hypothetical protein